MRGRASSRAESGTARCDAEPRWVGSIARRRYVSGRPAVRAWALVVALLLSACTLQIVYRDGCFYVSGVPAAVKAVRVKLKTTTGHGIDTFVATHPVGEDGRTTPFCLGEAFRRTYAPGEIEITTYDDNGAKTGEVTNKENVSVDGTGHLQEVPYGAFQ